MVSKKWETFKEYSGTSW